MMIQVYYVGDTIKYFIEQKIHHSHDLDTIKLHNTLSCEWWSNQQSLEQYLRNRSAPAVNCWVIIHCLEVSCKEDQITSAQREWFIFAQLTDKQRIISQQFMQWSWSISILTHNKRRKHIRSPQLLPTFRHCTEELPPIFRLRRIRLHVIVTSFKRKNDVTPSNAMNDVIFQWRQLSHTFAVNYCPIYHSLLPLAL